MDINKGTHAGYRTELFMPIMKEADGKYIAVLSDDSVDRDDEYVSKSCIEQMGRDGGYLTALCNHENDVFKIVAEWVNLGCREIDGHTALIAEPKFFVKSSPQARQIKGMLDEGAKFGISIGAMVLDYEEVDGKRKYIDLELVEASFVGVPSNRHGRAMAIAKSFNQRTEETTMETKFTQKDIDSAVEKKNEDFQKQLDAKDAEIAKLQDDMKKSEEEAEEEKAEAEEAAADAEEADKAKTLEFEKKLEEAEKALKAEKKLALEKDQYNKPSTDGMKPEDTEKAFKEGKLPFARV